MVGLSMTDELAGMTERHLKNVHWFSRFMWAITIVAILVMSPVFQTVVLVVNAFVWLAWSDRIRENRRELAKRMLAKDLADNVIERGNVFADKGGN